MADTDGFHLDRPGQRQLLDLLGQVKGLAVDLKVTIARQDRVGQRGRTTTRHRPSEQPAPIHLDALAIRDELHATLTSWARYVADQRQIPCDLPAGQLGSPVPAARWLRDHIIDLALCEGADDALIQIKTAIEAAEKIVLGPVETLPQIDEHRLAQARILELTASQIETVGRGLGPAFKTLTRRRVNTLHEGRHITPIGISPDTEPIPLYRLGLVLDAHQAVAIRQRRKTAAA